MTGSPLRLRARLGGSVLALRDFRLLWVGQAVSAVGDQIFPVAVSLRVLENGGDAGDIGLVLAGRVLALVVFVLAGGVWADRLPRRRVLLAADALRLVAVGGLAIVPAEVGVPGLAALTFVVGGGEAFFRPAYAALVPSLVPPERLASANACKAASEGAAAVVGPALGGLLVAVAGTRLAFGIDAATFAAGLVCVLLMAEPAREFAPRVRALAEVREGLSAVRRTPWASAILVMASVQLMLVVAPHTVLLPIVATRELGGESAYGLILAVFSLSGLAGTLVVGRLSPRHPGTVAVLCASLFTAVPVVLLTPVSLAWVTLGYAVAGFAMMPLNVLWETALQREFPPALLGRVTSVDWLASFALLPVGLAIVGPAVDLVGRGPVLAAAATVQVASSALVLLVPGVRDLHDDRRPARV